MSQRSSGYERQPLDDYQTPAWVTEALLPHLPPIGRIWEPAAGKGKMVVVLRDAGYKVHASDIRDGGDFLVQTKLPQYTTAIVTNPPYTYATEFIEHALELLPDRGVVAMLLRCDFDSAASRYHMFGGCSAFLHKVVLLKCIQWFKHNRASPSFNHAWFVWLKGSSVQPTIRYAPHED